MKFRTVRNRKFKMRIRNMHEHPTSGTAKAEAENCNEKLQLKCSTKFK